MKVIIAGSRNLSSYWLVGKAISESKFELDEIVSGHARGVDSLAERYAKEHDIPLKLFPANWNQFGKAAGPIRNWQMAEYADALIAIWDGKSKGTKNMIRQAEAHEIPVYIKLVSNE